MTVAVRYIKVSTARKYISAKCEIFQNVTPRVILREVKVAIQTRVATQKNTVIYLICFTTP